MQVPTMKVKNPKGEGYWIVNEADFDPEKYEVWSDEPEPTKEPEVEDAPKKAKPKAEPKKAK